MADESPGKGGWFLIGILAGAIVALAIVALSDPVSKTCPAALRRAHTGSDSIAVVQETKGLCSVEKK